MSKWNVIYIKEAITLLLFQRFHTNFRYILYIYLYNFTFNIPRILDCALSTYLHVTSRYIKYRYSCQYSLQYVMVRSILNLFNLWTNSSLTFIVHTFPIFSLPCLPFFLTSSSTFSLLSHRNTFHGLHVCRISQNIR